MRICLWWQSVSRECQMETKKTNKKHLYATTYQRNIDVRRAALLAISHVATQLLRSTYTTRKIALISEICITFNEIFNRIIYALASKFNKVHKLYTAKRAQIYWIWCVRGLDCKTVNKFQQSTALGELSCNVAMLFLRDRAKKNTPGSREPIKRGSIKK